MDDIEQLLVEWAAWARTSGLRHAEFRVERLGVPHKPTRLPAGWQGVYTFRYGTRWLKVGKAGPNSAARWLSHHYGVVRAMSTLAFCLVRYGRLATIEDPRLPRLRAQLQPVDPDAIGEWMKKHTERVNVLIRSEAGPTGLAQLEAIAHRHLNPVFEGAWTFGGPNL